MAARKKPKPKPKVKSRLPRCLICGKPHDGRSGDVCPACLDRSGSSASRRVAEKVRNRVQGSERGGFVCPFCRCELSWETVKTSEIEVTIYVREKIYYCPSCRAFLGVSSWHTEG